LPTLHKRKEIIAKIVGCAFFPRGFVLRAETGQRLSIRLECTRRSVSLVRKVTQEFLDERILCCRVPAALVILRAICDSTVIAVLMLLRLGNNSQRFLDFARNDKREMLIPVFRPYNAVPSGSVSPGSDF
jgi:hypothetical protein